MKFYTFLLLESLYNKSPNQILSTLLKKNNNSEEIIKKLTTNLNKYKKLNKQEYIIQLEKALNLYIHYTSKILQNKFFNTSNDYKDSLLYYKSQQGKQLNFLLKSPLKINFPIGIQKIIKNLDEFLLKNPLQNNLIVYRGIKYTNEEFKAIIKRKKIINTSFSSTSHSSEKAKSFSKQNSIIPGVECLLKIHCKKGQKVAFIDNINSENPELEFLIARDSIFKITKINKINENYYELDCDLIQ